MALCTPRSQLLRQLLSSRALLCSSSPSSSPSSSKISSITFRLHSSSSLPPANSDPSKETPLTPNSDFLSSNPPKDSTHFGFREVPVEEKQSLVKQVFESVSSNYDVMNDFMSVGIHRLWKDYLIQVLNPSHSTKHLDVAGGTGDIAFRFLDYANNSPMHGVKPSSHVTVLDINPSMLMVGRKRAVERKIDPDQITWVEGNAESLPIASDTMDSYTIGFGIRNCTNIDKVVKEAYRVLKPGGRFLCLEFSHIPNPVLQQFYDAYSFGVIPVMGQVVANDRDSYQYLVESIRRFPKQEAFAQIIKDAGFKAVSYENLTLGIAAIHSGFKI